MSLRSVLLRTLQLVAEVQCVPRGREVVVYQIGDLFDLWRQADVLDPEANVTSAIQNDHAALLSTPREPDLNTQFLLGNHHYDLYRFPNFDAWQGSFIRQPVADRRARRQPGRDPPAIPDGSLT